MNIYIFTLCFTVSWLKIPLWWLNLTFSRTAHMLEGEEQKEDTNCSSENSETEKDFAPFKKVLNERNKSSSAFHNLRKKAYYMKSAWQSWDLRFLLEFPKRTKITRVHKTELHSNSSSDSSIPNYKPREELYFHPSGIQKRKCQDRHNEKLPPSLRYHLIQTI